MSTAPAAVPTADRRPQDTNFNAYAVRSRSGPHVTLQAGVLHAGRFWTTTSCASLKTRSVRAHGIAGAVVPDGDLTTVLSGRTSAIHALWPSSLVSDPTAPMRAPGAVLRLGVAQAEQLVGYLEASARIPAGWLPHRRVLLVTRPERSITLEGFDVVDASGRWSHGGAVADLVPTRTRRRTPTDLPLAPLPTSHRGVVQTGSRVHLGFSTPTGPIAVPARWPGGDRFVVSAGALAATGAELPGAAVAVFDQSASRRPDEKLGVMFRGRAMLLDVDGTRATVGVQADRITTWDGFEADTVAVAR